MWQMELSVMVWIRRRWRPMGWRRRRRRRRKRKRTIINCQFSCLIGMVTCGHERAPAGCLEAVVGRRTIQQQRYSFCRARAMDPTSCFFPLSYLPFLFALVIDFCFCFVFWIATQIPSVLVINQARVSRSALTMIRATGPRPSMDSGFFFLPFLFFFRGVTSKHIPNQD